MSDAAAKGIEPGDLITEAGQQPVTDASPTSRPASRRRRAAGRKSLLLLIRRDGDPRFVALSLGDA